MESLSRHPESGLSDVSKTALGFFFRPLAVKLSACALFLPENQRKKIPRQAFCLVFLRNEPRAVAASQRRRQRATSGPANPTHPQTRTLPAATLPAPREKTPIPFDRKWRGRTNPQKRRAGKPPPRTPRGPRRPRAEGSRPHSPENPAFPGRPYPFFAFLKFPAQK